MAAIAGQEIRRPWILPVAILIAIVSWIWPVRVLVILSTIALDATDQRIIACEAALALSQEFDIGRVARRRREKGHKLVTLFYVNASAILAIRRPTSALCNLRNAYYLFSDYTRIIVCEVLLVNNLFIHSMCKLCSYKSYFIKEIEENRFGNAGGAAIKSVEEGV